MKNQNTLGFVLLGLCIIAFLYNYPSIEKYSSMSLSLTSDNGSQGARITSDKFDRPVMANLGVNVWKDSFNMSQCEFNKRYKLSGLPDMPHYPERYSMTGEFIEDGPLASNT